VCSAWCADKARHNAGGEGSSKQPPGAWKDIGGAMGKKYLEAFKHHNSITYSQVCSCLASHTLLRCVQFSSPELLPSLQHPYLGGWVLGNQIKNYSIICSFITCNLIRRMQQTSNGNPPLCRSPYHGTGCSLLSSCPSKAHMCTTLSQL